MMPGLDRQQMVSGRAGASGVAELLHPLQGGLPHVEFRQQAVPLPPVEELPAGFDAIFQFRSDALDERLAAHLKQHVGLPHDFFEVEAASLTAPVRAEIARRVLAATTTSVEIDPATGAVSPQPGGDFDVERYALAVSLQHPRILLLPLPVPHQVEPIEPSIRWTVRVDIGIPAPGAGLPSTPPGTGVDVGLGGGGSSASPTGQGGGGEPAGPSPAGGLRFIPLASGRAFTSARLERAEHARRYQVWARLRLGDEDPAVESDDPVFQALRPHGLDAAIDAALAPLYSHPDVQATPVIALAGLLRRSERLADVQSFRPSMVAVPGNTREFQVLCFCLNLGPRAEAGDLRLVRPFVADRKYGYYASLKLIRAVLALRWARADTPKTLTTDMPVQFVLEDGTTVSATAQVRFAFLEAPAIDLAAGEWGVADAIRLMGEYEIEVLELRRPGEHLRGNELGDLRGPEMYPYAARIYPFEDRTVSGGPAASFLDELGRRLMEPLYKPAAEPVRLLRLAGQTSESARAVVLTGNLV
jgi:hypothetical protein